MFERFKDWLGVSGRLLHGYWQAICGAWRVSALKKPIVSIFGGSHVKQNDRYALQAFELARMFSNAGISVLTGGGPGIMQAASCGVMPPPGLGKGKTIGIGVTDLEELPNHCVHEYIELNYFFARKWLLTRYATAVVVFPGGFGTLDELFELVTLVQTKKTKRIPIVLVGVEYWQPFIDWMKHEALSHGLIQEHEIYSLFKLTDDLDTVFCLVRDECIMA